MAKKRSTRNSNNTSINTSNNITNQAEHPSSSNVVGNEDRGRKQKSNPYYSWW